MKKIEIIGISGISGAGKSTLVKALSEKLNATSIFWDDFDAISNYPADYVAWYKNSKDYKEFNYQALADILHAIKQGQTVKHPTLQKSLYPTPYIIVDAPLGRAHEQTAQFIDFVFHVDTPLDIALARRLIRDVENHESDTKAIINELNCYLNESRPLFTEEGMCAISHMADYIIDGTQTINDQVQHVLTFLNQNEVDNVLDIKIKVVDEIDEKTKVKMQDSLIEYETKNGIDVNYKRFSLIMTYDNENIGVLNAYTAYSEIYVDDIWIDAPFRSKGLGRKLLAELENRFRGKGFNNINLVTSEFQAPEFYSKCGFKAEFRRMNEKNPKLTKTFFVKYFGEELQIQGILNDKND